MTPSNLIDKNLNKEHGTFYFELSENCRIDRSKFEELGLFVFQLHNSSISKEQRLLEAIKLWELTYWVSLSFRCHTDINDVYKVVNFNEEDAKQIDQILYYLSNWFSYEKEMDEESLKIGNWAL